MNKLAFGARALGRVGGADHLSICTRYHTATAPRSAPHSDKHQAFLIEALRGWRSANPIRLIRSL